LAGIAEEKIHNKKHNHYNTRNFPSSLWVLYSAFIYGASRDGFAWNIFVSSLLL